MNRFFKRAFAGASVIAAGTLALTTALDARQAGERTVYVSVMDGSGAPVGDMAQAEFTVKEDGADRKILKVERASEPLHYAILVDTTPAATRAVNDIRQAIKGFCELLLSVEPKTEFMFMEFGGAAMTVMDFKSDMPSIESGLGKLLPKQSESVLNEALVAVAKQFAKMPANSRRVILTINMEPTKDSTNVQARQVAAEVQKAGAVVWSVALQEGARRDSNRENLLKGLAANTGGRWMVLQGAAQTQLTAVLRSIAANSFSQYAVTYAQEDGSTPVKITDVGVTRQGVVALSMKWATQ